MCARRRTHFLLLRQKKVSKEKATLLCVSLRCATGNLRCSVGGCCRRTHCAHCVRSVQTCCGKSEHEVRVSFGTRTHPLPCASRHAQKGVGSHTGHCFARPSLGSALRTAGAAARSARVPGRAKQWPVCGSPPLLAAPAAGRLRGAHAHRSAHASCSDSPRLSERSAAKRVVSSAAAPRKRPAAGLPRSDSEGVADWGGAFSLLTFFWRSKRK